ncbi:alpha/beta hydrolase [Rhodococcus sp. NPDC058521]|uniref:alpha/beta hydrolase n=1 Tax=Rhodococcus sp. NPDC058521 TaxID=3346536 RepID=UPI00365E7798
MVEQFVTVPKSGDAVLLYVPNTVNKGQPIELVHYLHGRTGTYEVIDERHHLRDALLAAGYAVACPQLHGDQWGNRLAQDDLGALDDWIAEQWPVKRRFVIGESMGGTTAANMVRLRELAVDAVVFIAPSLSMQAVWDRNDEARASLIGAFGVNPDGTDLSARTREWDVTRHDPAAYEGVHLMVFASPDDPIANVAAVTGPWMDAVRDAKAQVYFTEVSGDHVSDDHFRPDDVVAFFDSF